MRRLAITVGKQGTWHVIAQMTQFVMCAMFLDMWLDNVQNPMLLETTVAEAASVVLVVVVVVATVMSCAGTASNWVI
jgi:predicted branched-subunit amino acid permease